MNPPSPKDVDFKAQDSGLYPLKSFIPKGCNIPIYNNLKSDI